jgi:phenylalanyl-tRNA synthetase alpha chain
MLEKINQILAEFESDLTQNKIAEDLRIKYLSRKGLMNDLFEDFKKVSIEDKKIYGSKINELKTRISDTINTLNESNEADAATKDIKDYTLPGNDFTPGSRHPLNIIRNELVEIFSRLGYSLAEGPEIEDGWHNFSALNIAENHPARDMQDTFFISENPELVLRTHTSPVQIRTLLKQPLPVKIVSPGRVYRVDSDATHSPVFHQIEGIYVDKNVNFQSLKHDLYFFVRQFFGPDRNIRFRPSFFPFTEPSAEMDVSWQRDNKEGWMEILGCGMVDPQVLANCGIDPEEYTGFAFGIGIERVTMLKYDIRDIRKFYENDIRFLQQFAGE